MVAATAAGQPGSQSRTLLVVVVPPAPQPFEMHGLHGVCGRGPGHCPCGRALLSDIRARPPRLNSASNQPVGREMEHCTQPGAKSSFAKVERERERSRARSLLFAYKWPRGSDMRRRRWRWQKAPRREIQTPGVGLVREEERKDSEVIPRESLAGSSYLGEKVMKVSRSHGRQCCQEFLL